MFFADCILNVVFDMHDGVVDPKLADGLQFVWVLTGYC